MNVYNLPFTIPFGFLCVYWVLSIIGLFDVDLGLDGDLDIDGDIGGLSGGLKSLLNFVNATDVPIMLILTFISGLGLVANVAFNTSLNPNGTPWIGVGFIVASLVLAAVITRYVTKPLKPLFNLMNQNDEDKIAIIGRIGEVKSLTLDNKFGQVEVPHENNAPALLNCRLPDHYTPLKKGDKVLVTEEGPEGKYFLVRPAEELATNLESSSFDPNFKFSEELNKTNVETKIEQQNE